MDHGIGLALLAIAFWTGISVLVACAWSLLRSHGWSGPRVDMYLSAENPLEPTRDEREASRRLYSTEGRQVRHQPVRREWIA